MSKKITVYEISCPEVELCELVCSSLKEVADRIDGDLEYGSSDGIKEFNFNIKVKQMKQSDFDKLKEYEH